jgi:hypothetical protein
VNNGPSLSWYISSYISGSSMNKLTAMITPFMVNHRVIIFSCACWRASWVIISTWLCTPLVQFSYRQCNHRMFCALSLKDKFESWLKDLLEACTLTSKRSQLTGGLSLAHYNITMRSCLTLSIPQLSRGYVHNTEKLHHVDGHSQPMFLQSNHKTHPQPQRSDGQWRMSGQLRG